MAQRTIVRSLWRRATIGGSAAAAAVLAGGAWYLTRAGDEGGRWREPGEGGLAPAALAAEWTPPPRKHIIDKLKATAPAKAPQAPAAEFDVLVIGGGATGAGCALDAATRGLKVALVERDDFGSGTSSKSTKMLHGGVRYLEKAFTEFDFAQLALVTEALHERKTVIKIAPYLCWELPILLPIYKTYMIPYYWAGSKAYDLLSGSKALTHSYVISRKKALESFPTLRDQGLRGGLVYFDGGMNDARLNVMLALTALRHGAAVANHVEVRSLIKEPRSLHPGRPGSGPDVVVGAVVKDLLTGEEFPIRAKCVINATGPYTDGVRLMDEPTAQKIVSPSAGAHLVFPGYLCPDNLGLLDPRTEDGRVIYVLPWHGAVIAGTTDTPIEVTAEPKATEDEIEFILKEMNGYFNDDVKIRREDILAHWSGIRPLVSDPNAKNTASVVRNHLIHTSPSGLLTVSGGKWTTYRRMAEETIDVAVKDFGVGGKKKSKTEETPLVGAEYYNRTFYVHLIQEHKLPENVAKHLAVNYGDRSPIVASLDPAVAKASATDVAVEPELLNWRHPFLAAEVRYAVRFEQAATVADVLGRRMRLAFVDVRAAAEALPRVAAIMAEELGWSSSTKKQQIEDGKRFLATMGLPAEAK
ncbi:FAD dependent oxidoreductase-domain-containing protein [Hyaloraphidium curvatum]|nr:FAD dependent oxidoreductase-domain-containing protein [Hyaloraphidium curvatum]